MRASLAAARTRPNRQVLQTAALPGIVHQDAMLSNLCQAFDKALALHRSRALAEDVRRIMEGADGAQEGLDIRQ